MNMAENDDFFAPQTPEEQAIVDQGFKSDTPPLDGKAPELAPPPPEKEEPKASDVTAPSADEPKKAEVPAPNHAPKRADGEPEWQYNTRLKLWNARQEAANAKTPEEKEAARKKVTEIRNRLSPKSAEPNQPPSDKYKDVLAEYTDPALLDTDKKRVEALADGTFARKDDIKEAIRQERAEAQEIETQNKALNDFFAEHPDQYGTAEGKELFFDTLEEYGNYDGKNYDDLRFMFNAFHTALHPDNFEDTIAKAEIHKKKMQTVQFNGGNAANTVPKDAEKENLKKQYAAQGEDVDWLLED